MVVVVEGGEIPDGCSVVGNLYPMDFCDESVCSIICLSRSGSVFSGGTCTYSDPGYPCTCYYC